MKASPLIIVLLWLVCSSSLLAQRSDGRVYFDNRSSKAVAIYKMPLSNSNYRSRLVKTLGAGESFGAVAAVGEQYLISSGAWYRAVESITIGNGWQRRLVVSDADLRAVGSRRLTTRFNNRSGVAVALYKVIGTEEVHWAALRSGQSLPFYSFEGRQWAVRDASGRLLQRSSTPAASSTITIRTPELDRGFGGFGGFGGSRGGREGTVGGGRNDPHTGHDHSDEPAPVSLKITNSGRNSVVIYKKTRLGSRRYGTIPAGRSARVTTAAGETWRVEDAVTFEILRTIIVPTGDRHCEVAVDGRPKPQRRPEPEAREVRVRLQNDMRGSVDVYRRGRSGWQLAKRISAGRYSTLGFIEGQQILVKDSATGRELERFTAPSRDVLFRIRAHGDHAHVTGGNQRVPKAGDRPANGSDQGDGRLGRTILRRILLGE